MRGVVAVTAALLLTTVLSGCFVEDKDPKTDPQDPSGTVSGTRTATSSGTSTRTSTGGTGGNASNLPPTAVLTASAANGTAPLNVTFTINATDPEGATLSWTLSASNGTANATGNAIGNGTLAPANGTYAPANLTHQFTAAGNYTVTLTVRDAAKNATATVNVTVARGGPTGFAPGYDPACQRPNAVKLPNNYYVDDRPHAVGAVPALPGTGYATGDGTWIYEESNGIPGLQLTNGAPSGEFPEATPDPQGVAANCLNGDTLHF